MNKSNIDQRLGFCTLPFSYEYPIQSISYLRQSRIQSDIRIEPHFIMIRTITIVLIMTHNLTRNQGTGGRGQKSLTNFQQEILACTGDNHYNQKCDLIRMLLLHVENISLNQREINPKISSTQTKAPRCCSLSSKQMFIFNEHPT